VSFKALVYFPACHVHASFRSISRSCRQTTLTPDVDTLLCAAGWSSPTAAMRHGSASRSWPKLTPISVPEQGVSLLTVSEKSIVVGKSQEDDAATASTDAVVTPPAMGRALYPNPLPGIRKSELNGAVSEPTVAVTKELQSPTSTRSVHFVDESPRAFARCAFASTCRSSRLPTAVRKSGHNRSNMLNFVVHGISAYLSESTAFAMGATLEFASDACIW